MGLADKVMAGDARAAARLMRDLDDDIPGARTELAQLHGRTGRAHILGITGNPGAGKSTLTSELIGEHRKRGQTVGVVAVDPSSPFSGGAILGDRIRMQEHATDPGVFIRSMATRGAMGGLSRACADVVNVMDAMGKDVILVETVGVGQDEIDIVRLADTTVVVVVPGLGDEVQAIKAGIMEIADIFVVNKADREGADRTVKELQMMLHLRDVSLTTADARRATGAHHAGLPSMTADELAMPDWEPPIVQTVATRHVGIEELMTAVTSHRERLSTSGGLDLKRQARARAALLTLAQQHLMTAALKALDSRGGLESLVHRVAQRQTDPHTEVDAWISHLLARST